MLDSMTLLFLIVAAISAVVIGIIIFVVACNSKYKKFVIEHCDSIKQLKEINNKYKFHNVTNNNMSHSYDNENMYEDISCRDYLIYQLQFIKSKVERCMDYSYENNSMYKRYNKEIIEKCTFNKYDIDNLLRNKSKLSRIEQKEFNKLIKRPAIEYTIKVDLILTNINGDRRSRKTSTFNSDQIEEIICDLNDKRGSYYNNEYIWNAICRVERGKVTNKMRFAIYDRDHWRCRKCGRKTNDLEVDHIIPIAKGGKSTFDNLQTLCHRCNVRKGANIE